MEESTSKVLIFGSTEVDQFSIQNLKLTEEAINTMFENDLQGKLIKEMTDSNDDEDDDDEEDEVSNDDAGGITLKYPMEIKFFSKMKVVLVTCGAQHTIAINSEGKVFSWGQNDNGALGRTTNMNENSMLYKLPGVVNVPPMEYATAGDSHSIFYNVSTNQIFFVGLYRNDKREYYDSTSIEYIFKGLGNTLNEESKKSIESGDIKEPELKMKICKYLAIPVEVGKLKFKIKKISKVASGGQFTMFLTHSGELHTRGDSMQGNLGIGKGLDKIENSPLMFYSVAKGVADIYPCYDHSFYKTKKCEIYGYGSNTYGQLGIAEENIVYDPTKVSELCKDKEIARIVGGQEYTVATTTNGELYTFGNCLYGKLGITITDKIAKKKFAEDASLTVVSEPQLNKIKSIEAVTADNNYSYALTEDNNLYSWGMGTSFVLCNGKDDDNVEPKLIDKKYFKNLPVRQVALGSGHVVLLMGEKFECNKAPSAEPKKRKNKRTKSKKRTKKQKTK